MSIFVDIEKKLGNFFLKVKFEIGNETLSLFGASGCGKSMTLKCIAGIEKPDRGKIIIDGVTVFDAEKKINVSPQKRKVGLLFQNYALFPDMTVKQNIFTGAKRIRDKNEREIIVSSILEQMNLVELAQHYPRQLSGGQQQRVALARVLVSNPNILLLDEPFSALDSHLRWKLEQQMREIIKTFGKTVVLVSHDREEVFRMSDSIALMHAGTLETIRTKTEVFAHPMTKQGAILTGYKNIFAIEKIEGNQIWIKDWEFSWKVSKKIEQVTYIAIPNQGILVNGRENKVCCEVKEVIENPFSYIVMLQPKQSKTSNYLIWEIEKKDWNENYRKEMEIFISSESIILLKE